VSRGWTPLYSRGVAILYSSSQNSLWDERFHDEPFPSGLSRRNPLFIKSEFSQEEAVAKTKEVFGESQSFIHQVRILSCSYMHDSYIHNSLVAILYSSSQNSLSFNADYGRSARTFRRRNPLFIKSEFSQVVIFDHNPH